MDALKWGTSQTLSNHEHNAVVAKIFNQYAHVGDLHLETNFIKPHRWEWAILGKDRIRMFAGEEETVEGAKETAVKAAGLDARKVNWQPIGAALENLPD